MLSTNAFYEGLKAIEDTYVNKRFHLSDEQVSRWYKLLKSMNDESFLSAIDDWCLSKSTLPSPSDILEVSSRLRTVDNSVEIPKNKEHCKICLDTGLIKGHYFNQYLQNKYEYVCCCICEAGDYCKSIYPLPQADRNKLSREMQAPKTTVAPKQDINGLIKQMSMDDVLRETKEEAI